MYPLMLYCCLAVQLDPTLKKAVLDALGRLNRFQVNFRQETYSDFLDETRAEGSLAIERPGKMLMTYRKGELLLRVWDGETEYERDDMADTAERQPQRELSDEPMVRLLLYGSDLDKYFLLDRFQREGRDIYRLRPRDSDDYQVEIAFNEAWLPDFLEVIGEDGEGTRFWFRDYDLKPEFAPDTFTVPD